METHITRLMTVFLLMTRTSPYGAVGRVRLVEALVGRKEWDDKSGETRSLHPVQASLPPPSPDQVEHLRPPPQRSVIA